MLYSVIGLPACFCIFRDMKNNTYRPMIQGQFIKEIPALESKQEAEIELSLWWVASLCEA